ASDAVVERNLVVNSARAADASFWDRCMRMPGRAGTLRGSGIQLAVERDTYTTEKHEQLARNVIRNNLLVNTSTGLLYGSYGDGVGMRDTVIVNNTVAGRAERVLAIDPAPARPHAGTVVANNIFASSRVDGVVVSSAARTGITFRTNLWSGVRPSGAAAAGDVRADPRLTDVGGDTAADLTPLAGSPAAGAATRGDLPATDYFGRPRSGRDLGAVDAP
ncbi:MAG: hypothetical protein ACRCZP_16545, partial [Phycicoccus sp.]